MGRKKRKAGKKKKRKACAVDEDAEEGSESEEEGGRDETISASTVDQYVAAMVSLWEDQQRAGVNSYPHPRSGPVHELIDTLKRTQVAKDRREYKDRGRGKPV